MCNSMHSFDHYSVQSVHIEVYFEHFCLLVSFRIWESKVENQERWCSLRFSNIGYGITDCVASIANWFAEMMHYSGQYTFAIGVSRLILVQNKVDKPCLKYNLCHLETLDTHFCALHNQRHFKRIYLLDWPTILCHWMLWTNCHIQRHALAAQVSYVRHKILVHWLFGWQVSQVRHKILVQEKSAVHKYLK